MKKPDNMKDYTVAMVCMPNKALFILEGAAVDADTALAGTIDRLCDKLDMEPDDMFPIIVRQGKFANQLYDLVGIDDNEQVEQTAITSIAKSELH